MPKTASSKSTHIRQWLQDFPHYTTDGKIIFCQACNKEVSSVKKSHLTQHADGIAHKANVERKSKLKQTLLTNKSGESSEKNKFCSDLCHALVAANIPFRKLENPIFRGFLEKYCHQSIPAESTLRKNYVDSAYNAALHRIREDVGESCIWISVDETTDSLGRYIANLIIGKLDPDAPSRAHLIYSKQLAKTNQQTIAHFVNNGLKVLYPNGVDENKVLLAVTDAAAYMIAAFQLLKVFYPLMLHVTCVVHGINRIAEQVRLQFPKVNKVISMVKKIFVKAPSRILAFKEQLPDVPLPPEPVVTRWGTWLIAAEYYSTHLSAVQKVIENVLEDAAPIIAAMELLKDSSLKQDLSYIRAHYTFMARIISQLEGSGRPIYDNISLLEEVKMKINETPGEVGEKVRAKMQTVFQKNIGLKELCAAADILSGKSNTPDCSIPVQHVPKMKYAPVTSVEIERSFSAYKLILNDKRHSFSLENLEKILVIYCEANYGQNM